MQALVAYINWLSKDGVKGKAYKGRGLVKLPPLTGDAANGKAIYASQCAGCHGSDGAGVPPVLPAVWGPDSFNDGAGMNGPQKWRRSSYTTCRKTTRASLRHNKPTMSPPIFTPCHGPSSTRRTRTIRRRHCPCPQNANYKRKDKNFAGSRICRSPVWRGRKRRQHGVIGHCEHCRHYHGAWRITSSV